MHKQSNYSKTLGPQSAHLVTELLERGKTLFSHADVEEITGLQPNRHFVRSRRYGLAAPVDCGFTLDLRFSNPVPGPMCLGYGSHVGLGLFVPGPVA